MKRIVFVLCCLCGALSSFGQSPVSKNLSFMKDYTNFDLEIHFENCFFDSMNYDDYANFYDSTAPADKKFKTFKVPELIYFFINGIKTNTRLASSDLSTTPNAQNKMKVVVYFSNMSKNGKLKGFVNIYEKKSNLFMATFKFTGDGNSDGKLAQMSGKVSNIFKKQDTPDMSSYFSLASFDAGTKVGNKIGDADKTSVQKLFGGNK